MNQFTPHPQAGQVGRCIRLNKIVDRVDSGRTTPILINAAYVVHVQPWVGTPATFIQTTDMDERIAVMDDFETVCRLISEALR